jgi:predicted HTH transcriptional regulator
MTLPAIPERPQDWNIDTIDNLVQILSIESETFDFKEPRSVEKNGELYKDICAMANTSGGYIVLGVGEDKALDGTLIRFTKDGFRAGTEDKVNLSIANNVYEVNPTPSIEQVPPIYCDF